MRMRVFRRPDYGVISFGNLHVITQNEVCSCCMLVACKAQRENESQYLSRRNRQRIVVIVIHKSNITVSCGLCECGSQIPQGDIAQKLRFSRKRIRGTCVRVYQSFVRSFVRRVFSQSGDSVLVAWGRGFTVAGRGGGGFQSEGAGLQMHCKAIAHRSISCCFSFATRSASSSRFATAIFISIR